MSRRSIEYVASIFLILVVLTISGSPLIWLHKSCIRDYTIVVYYLAQLGLFVFLGTLLGFCDRFICEIRKNGSWKVDVRKITIWGIPIGLFACSYLIYYGFNISGITNYFAFIVNTESGQVVAAQIIFGYVLITSFYKKTG